MTTAAQKQELVLALCKTLQDQGPMTSEAWLYAMLDLGYDLSDDQFLRLKQQLLDLGYVEQTPRDTAARTWVYRGPGVVSVTYSYRENAAT